MADTKKSAKLFSAEERAAIQDRAKEMKADARRGSRADKPDSEGEVLAKIAELKPADRHMAERIHAVIRANAPSLEPKLWYGMPAYAREGKVVCFFQSAAKFKTRYATFGFNDPARLDDGAMWPVAFAVLKLTAEVEARIGALARQAAG